MIHYYRLCHLVCITVARPEGPERPPGEWLASEAVPLVEAWNRFADSAAVGIGPGWFSETPALAAHLRALGMGHSGSRLVDTEAACLYSGRTPEVLYRWAREGRLTRHKRGRRTEWDVLELPAAGSGPPPKRST